MPPRRHLLALLAVAAALSTGCASLQKMAASAVQPPRLSFVAVEVKQVDLEGATLAFDFKLENPNAFSLSLAQVTYALDVEDGRVVDGLVPGGLTLPSSGTAPLRFEARVLWDRVARFAELVATKESLAYRLSGVVGVETPIGVLQVPLSHAGRVTTPRPPALHLAGMSVRLASLTYVELEVRVGVANPNAFPLPAGSLRYDLGVGGEVVASSEGTAFAGVAAHKEGTVVVPVRLALIGAGQAAASALRGGSAQVRLVGEARLGGMRIPFDLSGRPGAAR